MEVFSGKETAFYVVIRDSALSLKPHYTLDSAVKEAKRLAEKEKDIFFVLGTMEAHRDTPKTMQVSLQELNYEPSDVKLDPLRYY